MATTLSLCSVFSSEREGAIHSHITPVQDKMALAPVIGFIRKNYKRGILQSFGTNMRLDTQTYRSVFFKGPLDFCIKIPLQLRIGNTQTFICLMIFIIIP